MHIEYRSVCCPRCGAELGRVPVNATVYPPPTFETTCAVCGFELPSLPVWPSVLFAVAVLAAVAAIPVLMLLYWLR